MIERGNPVFAVTQVTRKVEKIRDKTLKTNRLGLSWTDKGSKSSPTVRRKSGETNSRDTGSPCLKPKFISCRVSEEIHGVSGKCAVISAGLLMMDPKRDSQGGDMLCTPTRELTVLFGPVTLDWSHPALGRAGRGRQC